MPINYFVKDSTYIYIIASTLHYDEMLKNLKRIGIDDEYILSYSKFITNATYKDIEDLQSWDAMSARVHKYAQWITDDIKSVVDYGAGKMYLKKYLNSDVLYYPIDYIKRFEETILCDLNMGKFPRINSDATVCCAILEYIDTPEMLIEHVCKHTRNMVIIGYHTIDNYPNVDLRRAMAIKNDFSEDFLVGLMKKNHFVCKEKKEDTDNSTTLYLFMEEE